MEEQENIPYTDPEEPNRAATGERPSWLMVLCILHSSAWDRKYRS